MFDIPVVLFIFKRPKVVEVIKVISKVKPKKLYIIADGPRNKLEQKEVEYCRSLVESSIDWDCEIIKNYSDSNRGVYENIGKGAEWVFSKEEKAIFLEDDNIPEESFFYFSRELLELYQDTDKILWIMGSNYLEKFETPYNESYLFTRHMLPCGWASWSHKFLRYYDGEMKKYNKKVARNLRKKFPARSLYKELSFSWLREYERINEGNKPISWDFQMDFSIKYNDLYGICPAKNQIRNIGVDEYSIHGGTSSDNVMVDRFTENETYPIDFPLIHPKTINTNRLFEKKIGEIITRPLKDRLKRKLSYFLKSILRIPKEQSIKEFLKRKNKS